MNKRKTVLGVTCFFAALVLSCFLALLLTHSQSQLERPLITVSFAGYTNGADGQICAQFVLSNITESRVLVAQPAPIVRTNGQWSMMSAAGQPILLQARQQRLIRIRKPANVEAWRLPVFHGAFPSRLRLVALRVWRVLPWKPRSLDERMERAGGMNMRLVESQIRMD